VDGNCSDKDPINVIFSNFPLSDIVNFLEGLSWSDPVFEHKQFLSRKFDQKDKKMQDKSLKLGSEFNRHHMRFWNLDTDGVVAANIHYETWTLLDGHVPTEFEVAEKWVAAEFASHGFNIRMDAIDLGNTTSNPLNNGLATEIRR